MKCRWDADRGEYVTEDGETCETARRQHCPTRKSCSNHLGWGELNCARCIGRARASLRHIADYAPLLETAALESRSINSEAANLAGPAADPRGWIEYRLAAIQHLDHWLRTGRIKEGQYDYARETIDEDEYHPYNVLTRWHLMLAEDYSLALPARMTIAGSANFLDIQLTKMAHDEGQDFPLFYREIKTCRDHMDTALSIRAVKQRGVPCPTCQEQGKKVERLVRHCPEFCPCDDENCTKLHVADDSLDVWVCPRNQEHWWTAAGYANLLDERNAKARRRHAEPTQCA